MNDQTSGGESPKEFALYFNTSDASGFEVCDEISQSDPTIFYRPINKDDGLIYEKISAQGMDYLIQHIKLYNYVNTKLKVLQNQQQQNDQLGQQSVVQGQEEGQGEGQEDDADTFIKQFHENDIVNSLINQITNYPQQNEVILRQQIKKQIFQFEKVYDNSVTFCLLYENQEQSEIDSQIEKFKQIFPDRKTNIVILINGKEKFKLKRGFKMENKIKENKCNICYTYEDKGCIFFVLNEEQSTIRLLNWIYRGIFKHFQPQYFYVGYLSILIDVEKFRLMDRMMVQPEYFGATGYYNLIHEQKVNTIFSLNYSFVGYMNFLNYQFQIDSLAKLKRFHNPFFSYYKWNELYTHLDSYIKELEIENQKGNLNLHLNPLLPYKMFKEAEKQFFSAGSNLGEKKIIQDNQAQMFLDLSNMMNYITQCNDYALTMHRVLYAILLDLRKFESKIKLAQILFLYTFSPYQAYFYLNISRSYIKIIIAILCPFLLFILLLLFVLLVQQYQIGVTIVKKQVRNLYFQLNKNDLYILFKSKIHEFKNVDQMDSQPITIEINKKKYIFEKLIQELPPHQSEERPRNAQSSHAQRSFMENNINSQEQRLVNERNDIEDTIQVQNSNLEKLYKLSIQSITEKKVDNFYELLFYATFLVEFICSAIVIANLIFTYGSNLIHDVQNEQHFVAIIGIIIFIFFFIVRNFGFKKDQYRASFLVPIFIFLNLLITTVYSEMYHQLRIKIKPKEYLEQVQKLSQYLCLNILLLIIFYIVETSMNFEGYIFSIIIFYNLTLYLIDSVFVICAILKGFFNKINLKDETEGQSIRMYETEVGFLENYKEIVGLYLKDLRQQQQNEIEKKPNPTESNPYVISKNTNHQDLIDAGEGDFVHDPANLNNSSEIN
ncbi:unnamed protein product [Paramecium octaurelia]|uniref:Transmembrane protein n=1 Tax=Paramecium octaurelia TaxID=43137 RepID=A0A8S1VNR5_PAROT|nr:unnamed protein product [Paramecium octaurelia]